MPNSVKINCFFSSERIWYWSSSREKNCLGCGLKLKIAEGRFNFLAFVTNELIINPFPIFSQCKGWN